MPASSTWMALHAVRRRDQRVWNRDDLSRAASGRAATLKGWVDAQRGALRLVLLNLDGLFLTRLRAKGRRERRRKAYEGQEDEDGKNAVEQRALPIEFDTH
jgi:hypothetical protein